MRKETDLREKQQILARVTLIGMVLDLILSALKVVVGWLGHSHALIADGIHSLSDAASDVMVIVVGRYAHQAPDADHPYGHGKIETLGTVALGSLLIAVAGALAYESLQRVTGDSPPMAPDWPVLVVALLSIVSKEWIFRYTLKYGKRYRSDLIIANAWHSRSDAFSSVVVLFAALGAMLGYPWLDAVGAFIVAVIIAQVGWDLAWKSARQLVEAAVPEEKLKSLAHSVGSVPHLRGVHALRARYVGGDIVVDVHLQVAPKISVSEGHYIGLKVAKTLRQDHPEISDVTFHIDAEEDQPLREQFATADRMPTRQAVESLILERLERLSAKQGRETPQLGQLTLHYLAGHVDIDLVLITDRQPDDLEAGLRMALNQEPWFGSLRVWLGSQQTPGAR